MIRDEIERLAQSGDEASRKLARDVLNREKALLDSGIDPGDLEPRQSLIMQGLDVIDTSRQWVAGILDSAVSGNLLDEGIFSAASRGARDDITTSDILRKMGVEDPLIRGVVGFAGDVLLDPTTWMTFGTAGLARHGGTAVTKLATARAAKYAEQVALDVSKLGSAVTPAMYATATESAMAAVDHAGFGLRFLDENLPLLSKLKASGTESPELLRLTKELETATEAVTKVYGADAPMMIEQLIGRPQRFALEANLPFLGHFVKEEKSAMKELADIGGPIGTIFDAPIRRSEVGEAVAKTAGAVGKVLSPAKVTGPSWQLTRDQIEAFKTLAVNANERMAKVVAKADGVIRSLPGGDLIADAAKKTFDVAGKTGGAAGKLFNRTFRQAALIGDKAWEAGTDFINVKASTPIVAAGRVVSEFKDVAGDPELLRRAAFVIDESVKQVLPELKGLPEDLQSMVLQKINSARLGIENPDELGAAFQRVGLDLDSLVNARITRTLDEVGAEPALRSTVGRMQKYLDDLVLEERQAGLPVSLLDAYIPHAYSNKRVLDPVTKKMVTTGPGNAGFTKSRTYATLTDALQDGGLVADTNVLNLLADRTRRSLIKRAEIAYSQRIMKTEGLDATELAQIAGRALKGDQGAKAYLTGRGFRLPKATELNDDGVRGLLDTLKGPFSDFNPKRLASVLKVDATTAEKMAYDLQRLTKEEASEYARDIYTNLLSVGRRPTDWAAPKTILDEIGDAVKLPGSDKEVYVPKEVGRALRETIAGRDFLKNYLGGSEIGQRLLAVNDAATNFFKRFSTLPWPAYWSQNVIGDQLLKSMDGGFTAMNPGYIQKAHGILTGKHGIKTPYGFITPRAFSDILQKNGLNFGSSDLMGLLDATSKSDITKHIANMGKPGARLKNAIASGENIVEATIEGVKSAQETMQFVFGDFMRISHIIHRLERGDTISNAVRYGQEAMLNYRNMSPVEQSLLRRFFMFYGFLGQSTKRQLATLITRPADFAIQLKAARGAAELFSDPQSAPTADEFDINLLKSAASQEQISYFVGRDKTGKPLVARGFGLPINTQLSTFEVKLPRGMKLGDLVPSLLESATRTTQKAFAAGSPLPSWGAQLLTQKNLFFNKPLNETFLRRWPSWQRAAETVRQYPGGQIPAALFSSLDFVTRDILGGVPDGKGFYVVPTAQHWVLTNLIPGFGRLLGTAGTFTNAKFPTGAGLARALTGARIEEFNPEATALRDIRDILQETAQDKALSLRQNK